MGFLDRFRRGELKLGRIEAFSDGVFAIVVTLLVLELKVPELRDAHSARELGAGLLALLPKLVSWLISFVIVAKFWLNHHHLLSLARSADYGFVWLNSIFLMFQSFVPFPTGLLGEYPENPLAASLFGAVMALNTALYIVLHAYVARRLLKPELEGTLDPRLAGKSLSGVAGYLLGAASAWIAPWLPFVFYALTPLLFIVPAPGRKRA